jgi:predicted outer membrane protein
VLTRKLTTPGNEAKRRRAFPKRLADVVAISSAAAVALLLAGGACPSWAQTGASPMASASVKLSPQDYNFVAQANLGAPFQVDSGRIAEKGATTAEVRDYAHLMVVTHIPVVDALNRVLQRKNIEAPPNTLLRGAYRTCSTATTLKGRSTIKRGTRRCSGTRSSTAPIRTSKTLRGRLYQRSWIIWTAR